MECLRSVVTVGSWGIIKGNVLSYLVMAVIVVVKKVVVAVLIVLSWRTPQRQQLAQQ